VQSKPATIFDAFAQELWSSPVSCFLGPLEPAIAASSHTAHLQELAAVFQQKSIKLISFTGAAQVQQRQVPADGVLALTQDSCDLPGGGLVPASPDPLDDQEEYAG
jgi:hypothetical protein